MSRQFSSSARALIKYIWGKAPRVAEYEAILDKSLPKKKLLKDVVATAELKGAVHNSKLDKDPRATMILKDSSGKRITTAHVYGSGNVTFSKKEYDEE